ncbi:MAG: PHP domain-containing protein [Clostridiaceae bacterium]|nr:PHP domain-containing protein [Clostridiaceae bacterium]
MIKVDFHTHTTSSDGQLTPTEMVTRAFNLNVKYLAITDHDTISGLKEAQEIASSLDINIIPGIELSTTHNNESIHILGFFKDKSYDNEDFINFLNCLKDQRISRAKKMVDKLKEIFNIEINFENVLHRGKDVIARPHIAREIISAGYPYDMNYIFDNFIGKDCPAFVSTKKISTEEGIDILHNLNALVFLAHPKLIKKSPIDDFLKMNFDGIEAVYFQNTSDEEKYYLDIAHKNNLLVSAGSDCHGDFINDLRHGDIGCMKIESELVEKLLTKLR